MTFLNSPYFYVTVEHGENWQEGLDEGKVNYAVNLPAELMLQQLSEETQREVKKLAGLKTLTAYNILIYQLHI